MTSEKRTQIANRLRARVPEIRQAILDRLHAMESEDPPRELDYLQGLRHAVSQGVEYGIDVVEVGEKGAPYIPTALHAQPRLAARQRVPLDMVLRRLIAGKTLLVHYMLEEASAVGLASPDFSLALEALETISDRLLATAQDEYRRELGRQCTSPEDRVVRHVRHLLDGDMREWSVPNYAAEYFHLGLVANSPDGRSLIRLIARRMELRSLILMPSPNEVWGWFGSTTPINPGVVHQHLLSEADGLVSVGYGRSERDVVGWRLTHRQARAAAAVGMQGSITAYEEVALLIAITRDPLLGTSLRDTYLIPLSQGERGGVLRATLRAYFEANRNGSSAAAALGVSRQTVANRLHTVERRLNQPLSKCGDLLHAALRMETLGLIDMNHL